MNILPPNACTWLICAYALIPIAIPSFLYRPYSTGKCFYFRILTETAFLVWLWTGPPKNLNPFHKNAALASTAAFITVIILADILGLGFVKSLHSDFTRMEGLATWLHILLFLIMAVDIFSSAAVWRRFAILSVLTSTAICMANMIAYNPGSPERVNAILGNSAYLASYLLVHVFFCTHLAFSSKNNTFKTLLVADAALHILVIILSGTRSAFVALLVALPSIAVFRLLVKGADKNNNALLLFCKKNVLPISFAVAILISSAIVAGAMILPQDFAGASARQNEKSGLESGQWRIFSYRLSEPTISLRISLWKIAARAFLDRPLLGWGQEHFDSAAIKFFDPALADKDPWYDRPHNSFLYWLVSAGPAGMILFTAIGVAAISTCVLAPRRPLSTLQRATAASAMLAFGVNSLFVFNTISSLLPLFAFIAFISGEETAPQPLPAQSRRNAISASLLASIFVILLFAMNLAPIKTAIAIAGAKSAAEKDNPTAALAKFAAALDCREPWRHEALTRMAKYYGENVCMRKNRGDGLESYMKIIHHAIQRDTRTYPHNARRQCFYASFYRVCGNQQQALQHADAALSACPNHPAIIRETANILFMLGDFHAAKNALKKADALSRQQHVED